MLTQTNRYRHLKLLYNKNDKWTQLFLDNYIKGLFYRYPHELSQMRSLLSQLFLQDIDESKWKLLSKCHESSPEKKEPEIVQMCPLEF